MAISPLSTCRSSGNRGRFLQPTDLDRGQAMPVRWLIVCVVLVLLVLVVPRAGINYGESGDAMDNVRDATALLHQGLWGSIPDMIRWPPGIPLFILALVPAAAIGTAWAANGLSIIFYVASVVAF